MNDPQTSRRRYRWLLLALLFLLAIGILGVLARQSDTAVAKGLDDLQAGMTDAEVQAILKPLTGNLFMTKWPGQAGGVNLLAAWQLKAPFAKSPPPRIPQPFGDGDRNAPPPYELPRKEIRYHLLLDTPIRNGSFRTLGAHGNVFAIESFMDELADAAGLDPVAFRLAHLKDPRARAVVEAAAQSAGWVAGAKGDGRRGRGFAYSRYKTIGMYAAAVVDIEVDRKTGVVRVPKVVLAADLGCVVNPDGAGNQLEGGVIQAVSLALKEQVAFDRRQITSRDWTGYPILTFPEVPRIEVILMSRREDPPLGAGEGSVPPTSAAVANAFAHATGRRLRQLPMTPQRVKEILV